MPPQEVILEVLQEGWSFDGSALVKVDSEGGHTSVAQVKCTKSAYPVRVSFLNDGLPDLLARDEAELRSRLKDLEAFSLYRHHVSPRRG